MAGTTKVVEPGFLEAVVQAGVPVVVEFWAQRCGSCRLMAPVVDALNNSMSHVGFVRVDADRDVAAVAAHRVLALPTLIVFRDGHEIKRIVGTHSRKKTEEMLNQALASKH